MSHNHGIVTIQAGMYANFVGTHWWNMQEASFCYDKDKAALLDMNHDVLFREGLNYQNSELYENMAKLQDSTPDDSNVVRITEGEEQREMIFTPRLLCIDLKENFKGMKGELVVDEPVLSKVPEKLKSVNDEGMESVHVTTHEANCQSVWDGHLEVLSSVSRTLDSDQGIEQSSCRFEIYNPEDVNVEASVLDKHTSDACWCHFHHDQPNPQPDLAPHSWSTFLNTGLHPKSPCLIDEYSLNDSCNPLEVYGSGVEAYSCEDSRNDIEEKLRWYVEECDYVQGFQILVDAYNGFGGVADCILQHLDDEYKKKATFCFPVFQNSYPLHLQDTVKKVQQLRLYSTLLSFNSFNGYCSLFSPLSVNKDLLAFDTPNTFFPYAHLKPQLLYHSSAVLAGALECVTAAYRLKTKQFQMSDIIKSTSFFGRKLLSTNICFPFHISATVPFQEMVNNSWNLYCAPNSLTPLCDPLQHKILSQFVTLRGVPKSMLYSTRSSACSQVSAEDLLYQYVQKYSPSSMLSMSVLDEKCKVTPPFPSFFCLRLNTNGYVTDTERSYSSGVKSVPSASFLCNSSGTYDLLGELLNQSEKLNLKSYAKHKDPFVEVDDFSEAIQDLLSLRDCYSQDYS